MKKKTLIIPVVAAMLAVSCGDSPAPGKDWSKEIKDFMTAEFGEVLPYFDFDEESLVWESEKDEYGGYVFACDDNETDLTEAYSEKLTKAGFVFDEESEAYYKQAEKSTIQLSMHYFTPSSTSTEKPGNVIDIEYLYNDAPTGEWSEAIQAKMMSSFGEVLPYAYFDAESTVTGNSTTMEFHIYDDNYDNKLVSYGNRLINAGWELGYDYSAEEYCYLKEIDGNLVQVTPFYFEMEGYIPGNEIDVNILSATLDEFPYYQAEIALRYASNNSLTATIPEFEPASDKAFYVYEEYASRSSGEAELSVYCYETTSEDLADYVDALIGEGFILHTEYEGDYMLDYPYSGLQVIISDYTTVIPEDPEEGGDEGDVPPPPSAPAVLRGEGEEAGEGEEVEPEPEETALITFIYDVRYKYELDNLMVAQTIAFSLGLDFSLIKEEKAKDDSIYYSIYVELKDTDIETVYAAGKKAIPANYYTLYPAAHQEFPSEEDPTKIEFYGDSFVVDGWEEGGQMVILNVADMGEGVVALYFEVSGEPIEEEGWTAKSAIDLVFEILKLGWEPEDLSSELHVPAYGTGINFGDNSVAAVCNYLIQKLYTPFAEFTPTTSGWVDGELQDGTPTKEVVFVYEDEAAGKEIRLYLTVYEGSGGTIAEVMTIELTLNESAE